MSSTTAKTNIFGNIGGDAAAGLVVFFVALPLCLGIALASGAPLFAGIVTGIVGGLIVGVLSKSHLSVSGPAAGLAAIVLTAITDLGAFNIFLCAVVIAGVIQLGLGFLKAGSIANYFPSNVIEGMLAGIGVIIILKQLPHAVGFDKDYEGNESFQNLTDGNTFSAMSEAFNFITPGAVVIALVSIAIMLTWEKVGALKKISFLPGALVAVTASVVLNELFIASYPALAISSTHLVSLPVTTDLPSFLAQFTFPDWNGFTNSKVWVHGATIAVVASIETLLCIEAVDRLDQRKRITPTNHELKAQGIGNIISGFLGGLPMTSVIVRSSANVNAGAHSKLSTIVHGFLLLVCAATIPFVLNKIPLAVLAAILILTGYKLARPALFAKWWNSGIYQFIPFAVTIVAIVMTDLLIGVALGMVVSIFFILRENLKTPYFFERRKYHDGDLIHLNLAQEVSFLNKAAIKQTLEHLPENSRVVIDATETLYIDYDVLTLIKNFRDATAAERNIQLELIGFKEKYQIGETGERQLVYSETMSDAAENRPAVRGDHTELLNDLTNSKILTTKNI